MVLIYAGRPVGMNWIKEEMAQKTNLQKRAGSLAEQLVGADVFIGVSAPGQVTREMVAYDEPGPHYFRLRQPDAGDLPG